MKKTQQRFKRKETSIHLCCCICQSVGDISFLKTLVEVKFLTRLNSFFLIIVVLQENGGFFCAKITHDMFSAMLK